MNTRRTKSDAASRKATRALTCFVCGIGAALLGSVLSVVALVQGAEAHPWLRGVGTAFLVLIIPLLILAGFYLDDMEHATNVRTADKQRNRQRGSVFVSLLNVVTICLGLMLIIPAELQAQQTVFNVPTTDVLDKGKVYAELDASLKPTDGALVPKFSSYVPRVVVGAGNGFEIGLNVTGNIQPGPDFTTLVPTIKWKPYQGKDNGWAFVVGDNLFVPVRNRSYNAGNYVYAEVSKTLNTGTKITLGGYDFTRNVVAIANRAGGQFGFEQPINKKISFAADWLTGKHSAGYFTPGLIFKAAPNITGYAGYSIGNLNFSNGNHFFLLELGYNFN